MLRQEKAECHEPIQNKNGKGESLRDFMKHFRGIIHQLDIVSMDSMIQVVKQAMKPSSQFFNSISFNARYMGQKMDPSHNLRPLSLVECPG